jgi:hypothetical protein
MDLTLFGIRMPDCVPTSSPVTITVVRFAGYRFPTVIGSNAITGRIKIDLSLDEARDMLGLTSEDIGALSAAAPAGIDKVVLYATVKCHLNELELLSSTGSGKATRWSL